MAHKDTRIAYGEALVEYAESYEFVVLDADLSKATQTQQFANIYPRRFYNMGISEADMMSTAAGMASCEKTVFASTFAMFATGRAYEQIRNSIAYPKMNVKIAATHGGILIGEDGASHQCFEDIALMRGLPNMCVLIPTDEYMARKAVLAAIKHSGPVYLRFGRTSSPAVYDENCTITIGQGNLLKDGEDITILAIGDMVYEAKKACALLELQGIDAALIDMVSMKPLDRDLILEYAQKTKKIVTVEDHSVIGGLGSAVLEVLEKQKDVEVSRIGIQDQFGCSGTRAALMKKFGLHSENIVDHCLSLLGGKVL